MGKIINHDGGKRFDFHVENDSGALSVVVTEAVDAIVADGRQNDEKFVKNHQAVLLTMPGDNPYHARLILGGPLTEEENAEWVAKVSAKLKVGKDGILICGGFDPRFLVEWKEQIAGEEATIYQFKVPAGEYNLDVYTCRGVTGAGRMMEEEWPKRLGSWFREEYPGQPFPAWIALEMMEFPDCDPGHEKEWENLEKSIKAKKIAMEDEAYGVVDYIFHLTKSDPAVKLSEFPEGGWFEYNAGVRVPPRRPNGVRYHGADEDMESFLEEINS
jgi:hypothetical protein